MGHCADDGTERDGTYITMLLSLFCCSVLLLLLLLLTLSQMDAVRL